MRILVDAILFQLRIDESADAQVCARVLVEMIGIAAKRDIALTFLDRGGLPDLGQIERIPFPAFKAADAIADAAMLQRMGQWVGANAFISTALTMPPSLSAIQLLFGESESTIMPGRDRPSAIAECEIALAFSCALLFASSVSEEAFRSCFPRRHLRSRRWRDADAGDSFRDRQMAQTAIDAAVEAISVTKNADLDRKFLALRRMQAAFELSGDASLAGHP